MTFKQLISSNSLLLGLSFILLGLALVEILFTRPETSPIQQNIEISTETSLPTNLAAIVEPDNQFESITNSPLFTTNRQPYEAPVEEQAIAEPEIAQTPEPEDQVSEIQFTIQGIIRSPQTQIALIQVNNNSAVTRVRVDDSIAGWVVSSIEDNQVFITKDGETQTLLLVDTTTDSD